MVFFMFRHFLLFGKYYIFMLDISLFKVPFWFGWFGTLQNVAVCQLFQRPNCISKSKWWSQLLQVWMGCKAASAKCPTNFVTKEQKQGLYSIWSGLVWKDAFFASLCTLKRLFLFLHKLHSYCTCFIGAAKCWLI